MSAIVTTFMNYIVGTETTQNPDATVEYMMAVVADPQTMNTNTLPHPTNQMVQGPIKTAKRQAAPQTPPTALFGVQATETTQNPDATAAFVMAVVDDPRSNVDWLISNDYTPNKKCNFPPQVGGG